MCYNVILGYLPTTFTTESLKYKCTNNEKTLLIYYLNRTGSNLYHSDADLFLPAYGQMWTINSFWDLRAIWMYQKSRLKIISIVRTQLNSGLHLKRRKIRDFYVFSNETWTIVCERAAKYSDWFSTMGL